jgi:energy-coupling factor transporter ATP-binding protein EcfA2
MVERNETVYLRDCLIENVGPIEFVDLTLPFNENGTPKPVVLVGRNGSGKSILLSHIVDALIEFAKTAYHDILIGQGQLRTPYFKVVGSSNQRSGTDFGVALLRFSDSEIAPCYVDKSGTLDAVTYAAKMNDRFPSLTTWPVEGNHKETTMSEKHAQRFFSESAVCFFPSARHERPHWLNPSSVKDDPVFYFAENLADRLHKPVIIESAAGENKQWLLDVILDSLVEVEPYMEADTPYEPRWQLRLPYTTLNVLLLRQSRTNVEEVLKAVLQDPAAQLLLNYRTISPYRLSVRMSGDTLIPSLDHLSSGQANLFNLFSTIIRYADRADINKSHRLQEIEGMVLVDEIEAQAHSDLQYEVLPRLLKLFPKVQFILTSHSPLFLLGMEKEYGSDGFHIVEMPTGHTITTERFSEFERSWEYYRQTAAAERHVQQVLRASSKPMILTEGETDQRYITTALELLDRSDLLDAVDVRWVGSAGANGPVNSGDKALNSTAKTLSANPEVTSRRVLLLYDSDTNKPAADSARVSVRTLPRNDANTRAKKGIENLFPEALFEERFYSSRKKFGNYGEQTTIETFGKVQFCRWLCEDRRQVEDFRNFGSIVAIIEEFLSRD